MEQALAIWLEMTKCRVLNEKKLAGSCLSALSVSPQFGSLTARTLKEDRSSMQATIVLCRNHNSLLNLSKFKRQLDSP
jgi:hypothetical protein